MLHGFINTSFFAVAQKKYTYIYDNQGTEIHRLQKHTDVNRMQFLPYHFLLATVGQCWLLTISRYINSHSLDPESLFTCIENVSTSWTVSGISVSAKSGGREMATSGMDGSVKVWDARMLGKGAVREWISRRPATDITYSQRGLLGVGWDRVSQDLIRANWIRLKSSKRREKEKFDSLLDKIRPETITLDPDMGNRKDDISNESGDDDEDAPFDGKGTVERRDWNEPTYIGKGKDNSKRKMRGRDGAQKKVAIKRSKNVDDFNSAALRAKNEVNGHVLPAQHSSVIATKDASLHSDRISFQANNAFKYDPSPRHNSEASLEDWSALERHSLKNEFLNILPQNNDVLNRDNNAVRSSFTFPSAQLFKRQEASPSSSASCPREPIPEGRKIGFGILVPILVLLSGVFAGLTLGYMSLDETQLSVLMTTGDEIQRERARKIMPIRKDGHLLLTTLLIANMITNETLPVIFDPLLPGGVYSVIISTALIVIFSELIPQSTCSRYGLQIGAVMAFPTRIIIIIFWPIAWPVSRILHWVLGPHHGIVYRRAELKELVTMHAASGGRGGDLNRDTVMIVGGALDLQEKVVKQAMTPIDKVFMLPFTAKLDYPTLEKVVRSGHSRIPIYQEVEVPVIGTLLVKSCVLLDPEDAVPVSSMIINALPTVPGDEPLLNVLNVFQEGRSHMAIVSPRPRRGMNESTADLGSKSHLYHSSQGPGGPLSSSAAPRVDGLGNIDEEKHIDGTQGNGDRTSNHSSDDSESSDQTKNGKSKSWRKRFGLSYGEKDVLEQSMPSDAMLDEKKHSKRLSTWAPRMGLN
ncbi:hypothetical protein L7F22_007889 [Adiantum nelumboides]|nr:hypothetical protein [Adiantum nelumboides]